MQPPKTRRSRFFRWLHKVWRSLGGHQKGNGPNFFGLRVLLLWLALFLFLAGVMLVAFGFLHSCASAAAMIIWSFGLCAAGTIVGFLFGIPRVVSEPTHASVPHRGRDAGDSETINALITEIRRSRLAANTNLEQVSDWLTKVIVGVGLIELTEIPRLVHRLATVMAYSFGPGQPFQSIATGIIVLYTAGGFAIGYVTTRAFLPHVLEMAEQNAIDKMRSELQHLVPSSPSPTTRSSGNQ